jgi:2-hydroxymuconate-semialdehyde hydrolase
VKEYDIEFEGYGVRCYEAGAGMPLLLLHGVGPGTSIRANFGAVLEPLSSFCHVIGCDFIGFGGSGQKREAPLFDFDLWIRQAQFVLDRLPSGPVGVIGHSMGGAIALKLARANPRVAKVITSGAAGGTLRLNEHVETFWKPPETRKDIRNAMKVGMFNHSSITDELIEERFKVISGPGYKDYFTRMLGGDKQAMLNCARIAPLDLTQISARVVVMHGRDDLPCPAEETALQIYRFIPKADLFLLHDCGHAIPREYPHTLVAVARLLFGQA